MPGPVARVCDAVLDATVVLLATWTVVYHVSLVAGISAAPALLAEAALLAVSATAWLVLRKRVAGADPAEGGVLLEADPPPGPHEDNLGFRLALITVVAALAASVAMAASFAWPLVFVSWLVAGIAGSWWALRRLGRRDGGWVSPPASAGSGAAWHEWFALVLAVGAAVFSTITLRPNPDDLFYLNLSQWIAEHGSFPHRDTIFAGLAYPMSNWPPLASYDAGTGALAHLFHASAGQVEYVWVTPVATLLSVLALWRLLRAWSVPRVPVALVVAIFFLLLDGTSSYGPPGNLWLTRLWQGKVILLCLLVPLLLVAALRYAERPTRARAGWLFVLGTASVALSTTAVFLVPVVALAGVAPLVRRSAGRALLGFVAMAAYPLGSGVVTIAIGGRSADDFGVRKQYRFDPSWFGHEVFLDGAVALVGVAAVLLGCLLLPHALARVTSGVAALVTGITFVPGLTHLSYDLVGLGPTLWRITWACSVAALVGAGAAWVVDRVIAHWHRRWQAWVAALVAIGLVAALGSPIWAADTSTSFAAPFHWQRGADSRKATNWILARTHAGDRILAPDGLSITVAVTTTDVLTVAPRDYYMYYLRNEPGFDYDQRLTLVEFANHEDGWVEQDVAPALAALDVKVACVYLDDGAAASLLEQDGFRAGLTTTTYRCLSR